MNVIEAFKKELEAVNLDSVRDLFREATKPSASLIDITEDFSFGCRQKVRFNADDVNPVMILDWYIIDNEMHRHDIVTGIYDPINEDLSDCINRVLQYVYTGYGIDVWKSIKSRSTYCFPHI